MTIGNVLFTTDFSRASQAALPYAASLAHVFHTELVIAHVIEPAALYESEGTTFYAASPEDSARVMRMLKQIVPSGSTVAFRHVVLTGHPADAIVEFADREHIGLIVMTTHGRSGLQHLLVGSVAERVIRTAKCPVMTLKPDRQAESSV